MYQTFQILYIYLKGYSACCFPEIQLVLKIQRTDNSCDLKAKKKKKCLPFNLKLFVARNQYIFETVSPHICSAESCVLQIKTSRLVPGRHPTCLVEWPPFWDQGPAESFRLIQSLYLVEVTDIYFSPLLKPPEGTEISSHLTILVSSFESSGIPFLRHWSLLKCFKDFMF